MPDLRSLILKRLETIPDLPKLSDIVYRIERVALDPRSNVRDVASVIETDPSICAHVLKLANSNYYQGRRQIGSINEAISRIGLKEIRRACLTFAAIRLFLKSSAHVDWKSYWLHSLAVAGGARAIAETVKVPTVTPEKAYVAGLLHEIGTIVLDQYFDRLYDLVVDRARSSSRPVFVVEKEALAIDHGEIGAWLMERWRFPKPLVAAVAHHHQVQLASDADAPLCQIIHACDCICSWQGLPGPGEENIDVAEMKRWTRLGLDLTRLPALSQRIAEEAERSQSLLAIASELQSA